MSLIKPSTLKSPDEITVNEVKELAGLVEKFLIASDFLNGFKESNQGNVNLSVIVSGLIFKNDESFNSFCNIADFLTGERVRTFSGKELIEFFDYTVNFLGEIELIGFFLKAGTILLTLIKD